MVKQIRCSGSPFDVGFQHGEAARPEVIGSIGFYTSFFQSRTKLTWSGARAVASRFLPTLQRHCPDYIEEMRGVAAGAGVELDDILALNVRTEIAYGMLSDGCTALAWKTGDASFLAQNWDWNVEQAGNIVCLHVTQPGKPTIHMMTEAGIIGKIGLNSAGVGVTLNAIQAPGVDYEKLPCHLALRAVLDSTSREDAVAKLRATHVASSCHITVADAASDGIGFECTAVDVVEMPADNGVCTHSNHLVKPHLVDGKIFLDDSPFRLSRIQQLIAEAGAPSVDAIAQMLTDEQNYPYAICRDVGEKSTSATLFSIVMDLDSRVARVKMGRPTQDGKTFELKP